MNNTQSCGRHEALPLANILHHSSYKHKQHLELDNCNFLTCYMFIICFKVLLNILIFQKQKYWLQSLITLG